MVMFRAFLRRRLKSRKVPETSRLKFRILTAKTSPRFMRSKMMSPKIRRSRTMINSSKLRMSLMILKWWMLLFQA
jgi:hypothetical protein